MVVIPVLVLVPVLFGLMNVLVRVLVFRTVPIPFSLLVVLEFEFKVAVPERVPLPLTTGAVELPREPLPLIVVYGLREALVLYPPPIVLADAERVPPKRLFPP